MSTALNDFIDSNDRQIIPSTSTSLKCHQQSLQALQSQNQQSLSLLSGNSSMQENIGHVQLFSHRVLLDLDLFLADPSSTALSTLTLTVLE